MNNKRLVISLAIVGIILLLVATAPAEAALKLRISTDGGATYTTVSDGGAGDFNSDTGAITYIGRLGVWDLNVATGVGSAFSGPGSIDLNSVNNSSGAGTLVIDFTETDFDTDFPGWSMLFGGTLTGPAGSTVSARTWANDSNNLFATESLIGTLGPFGPGAFAGEVGASASVSPLYSLTQRVEISLTGAGQYSGDLNLQPLPEPASLAVWGLFGLMGLAAFQRLRKKRRNQAS